MSSRFRNPIGRVIAAFAVLVVALGVVIASAGTAWAADDVKTVDSGKNGSATITIENATKGATYNVYKVFDATSDGKSENISYKVIDGKTNKPLPSGFVTDDAGNVYFGTKDSNGVITHNTNQDLTGDQISSIATYVDGDAVIATGSISTSEQFTNLEFTNLPYGYYYITSSFGSAVSVTSTNPNATLNDKNGVPTVDKTITSVDNGGTSDSARGSVAQSGKNAIAEVGSTVHFQSLINVEAGAENYVFRDNMTSQPLQLNAGSINVAYQASGSDAWNGLTIATDFTLDTTSVNTGDSPYTFKIAFDKTTTAATAALTNGSKIRITYSAKVTSDGLNQEPAKNSATISYGSNPTHTSTPSTTATYNGKIVVNKSFKDKNGDKVANVAGAGFVLRKGAGTNDNPYLYYQETKTGDSVTDIAWVSDIEDATEQTTTTSNNTLTFSGLQGGTYTVIEKTTPPGYNQAPNQEVRIFGATETEVEGQTYNPFEYTNLYHALSIDNTSGPVLPSTGGMGTTAFYVVGGVLIVGAIAYLAHRRKANANA